jgi:hypothetical protein
MPRGVPSAGFRLTKKRAEGNFVAKPANKPVMNKIMHVVQMPVVHETDAQIEAKLNDRFDILTSMTNAAIRGDVRSLIVSGPAGLGKSFTVEQALTKWDRRALNHTIVKGYVRTTGLYRLLYQNRQRGQVLVFDDADDVFTDDKSIGLLKAVCDSTERRVVSYLTEGVLIDEDSATAIPKKFEFEGTIIFITNYDFDAMIDRGHKLAPHFQALVSRSHYIDLAMKTKRDYLVRIKQVMRLGLLRNQGLDQQAEYDVLNFINQNIDRLRELSLRMAIKLGTIRKTTGHDWEKTARVTCCKNS